MNETFDTIQKNSILRPLRPNFGYIFEAVKQRYHSLGDRVHVQLLGSSIADVHIFKIHDHIFQASNHAFKFMYTCTDAQANTDRQNAQ